MRRSVFTPEALGSNALFAFFAQHFTHQFFKTDFKRGPGFQWGGHGVRSLYKFSYDIRKMPFTHIINITCKTFYHYFLCKMLLRNISR